jgi:hypothetical protein
VQDAILAFARHVLPLVADVKEAENDDLKRLRSENQKLQELLTARQLESVRPGSLQSPSSGARAPALPPPMLGVCSPSGDPPASKGWVPAEPMVIPFQSQCQPLPNELSTEIEEIKEHHGDASAPRQDTLDHTKSHRTIIREQMADTSARKSDTGEEKDMGRSNGIRRPMLPDRETMKEHVRVALIDHPYNVHDFYKTEGLVARIARSEIFDIIVLNVIAANSIWIAIELDHNKADMLLDAHWFFQAGEHSFCIIFTLELVVRFGAFQRKVNAFKNMSFVFDLVLVSLMIFETWLINGILLVQRLTDSTSGNAAGTPDMSMLRIVRLVKLMRMGRVVRLLRSVPELMILIKGLVSATRSVCFTLALLGVIVYMGALVICQTAQQSDLGPTYFPGMLPTMFFLFAHGVVPDLTDLLYEMGDVDPVVAAFFIVFILIASLCMLNMLVGILCEVVSTVSCVEMEALTVQYVNQKLYETLLANDLIERDGAIQDTKLSLKDYESLLLNPKTAKMLEEVGVDPVGLVDFTEFLFKGEDEIKVCDFTHLLLSLRGTNVASVKDIVDARKCIISEITMRLRDTIRDR